MSVLQFQDLETKMYSHARIKTFLSQKGPEIKPQARHPLGKGIAKPRIEYEECMKTPLET